MVANKHIIQTVLAIVITLLVVYYFVSKSIPTSTMVQMVWSSFEEEGECDALCETTTSEGDVIKLDCGRRIIKEVLFASFGNPSGRCPSTDFKIDNTCHAPNSKSVVETLCLNKQKCELVSSNKAFGGDPCERRIKWLAVVVKCEDINKP